MKLRVGTQYRKINEMKNWFFEKIKKGSDKPTATMTSTKRYKLLKIMA